MKEDTIKIILHTGDLYKTALPLKGSSNFVIFKINLDTLIAFAESFPEKIEMEKGFRIKNDLR